MKRFKVIRGTYTNIANRISEVGEDDLILTTDLNIPIPTNADNGKFVCITNGAYALTTTTYVDTNTFNVAMLTKASLSGANFTGNISVPSNITFTNEENPMVHFKNNNHNFYVQAYDNKIGIGAGWDNSTQWDTNGRATFPAIPYVNNDAIALDKDIIAEHTFASKKANSYLIDKNGTSNLFDYYGDGRIGDDKFNLLHTSVIYRWNESSLGTISLGELKAGDIFHFTNDDSYTYIVLFNEADAVGGIRFGIIKTKTDFTGIATTTWVSTNYQPKLTYSESNITIDPNTNYIDLNRNIYVEETYCYTSYIRDANDNNKAHIGYNNQTNKLDIISSAYANIEIDGGIDINTDSINITSDAIYLNNNEVITDNQLITPITMQFDNNGGTATPLSTTRWQLQANSGSQSANITINCPIGKIIKIMTTATQNMYMDIVSGAYLNPTFSHFTGANATIQATSSVVKLSWAGQTNYTFELEVY